MYWPCWLHAWRETWSDFMYQFYSLLVDQSGSLGLVNLLTDCLLKERKRKEKIENVAFLHPSGLQAFFVMTGWQDISQRILLTEPKVHFVFFYHGNLVLWSALQMLFFVLWDILCWQASVLKTLSSETAVLLPSTAWYLVTINHHFFISFQLRTFHLLN